MISNLLFILVSGLCLSLVDTVTLRQYCDQLIYKEFGSPKFLWHPQAYILGYYKRCMHHDAWVECLVSARESAPKDVRIESFEKNFPPRLGMEAAGIVFCDLRLYKVPPNKTDCHFNTTMCNKVSEVGDKCLDSSKKADCIWSQLSKCGSDIMYPIFDYEFGLLGGKCLTKLKKKVYPHARAAAECKRPPNKGEGLHPRSSSLACVIFLAFSIFSFFNRQNL